MAISPILCLLLNPVGELCDLVIDRAAFGHQLADLPVSMHNGGVVTAAKKLADFRQGELGQLAA